MRISRILGPAIAVPLVLAVGCGSEAKYARVAGRVTLNGQPLANATVSFQPIAEGSVNAPAPGSTGKTNDNGDYVLMCADGHAGACIGKHRVSISLVTERPGDSDARPPRGGWPQADKVPARYNRDSKEQFVVSAEGTNKANFDLTSP
jgi:hypothetical protein